MGFRKSGQDSAILIISKGGKVFVSESRDLTPDEKAFADNNHIPYETSHSDMIYNNDYIIISPGINPDNPVIKKAVELNVPVLPEIELAYSQLLCPLIGVTGTNGKSTTVYLTYQILKAMGMDAFYGGNINPGVSLSSIASGNPPSTGAVICELSSFQLEMTERFKPRVAVITNISDDHIDRHGSLEAYREAKYRIFRNQSDNDYAVLNADDPNLHNGKIKARLLQVSANKPVEGCYIDNGRMIVDYDSVHFESDLSAFRLPGVHNVYNLMFAMLSATLLGSIPDNPEQIIAGLKGMPHRMEYLGKIRGMDVYNNSMCTNPVAFRNSLQSVRGRQIVIVGGRNKDFDIDMIVESINEYAEHAILIGEAADMLSDMLEDAGFRNVYIAEDLRHAVSIAWDIQGCNVLNFSPGFASFDMFRDFIDRGEQFRKLIGDADEQ